MLQKPSYENVCILYDCGREGDELGNNLSTHFLLIPTLKALEEIFGRELIFIGNEIIVRSIFSHIRWKKIIDMHVRIEAGVKTFDIEGIVNEVETCTLLICLNTWSGTEYADLPSLLQCLAPVKSIGFYDCFDIKLPFNLDLHFCDLMFQCVHAINPDLQITDYVIPPKATGIEEAKARRFIDMFKSEEGLLLIVAPRSTCTRKELPAKLYPWALKQMLDFYNDLSIFILSANFEWPYADTYKSRIVVLDDYTIEFASTLIKSADYFIGPESDFLHIADLYKIPTVGIFGKLSPVHFCGLRFAENCSLNAHDLLMKDITSEQLTNEFHRLVRITN